MSITEAMRNAASPEEHSATAEAAEWLDDYLNSHHGSVRSADIKADGAKAGHSYGALKRARKRLNLEVESLGFPRVTFWYSKALTEFRSVGGKLSSQSNSKIHTRSNSRSTMPRGDCTNCTNCTHWEAFVPVNAVGAVGARPRARTTHWRLQRK
jgi:hypothetical protein